MKQKMRKGLSLFVSRRYNQVTRIYMISITFTMSYSILIYEGYKICTTFNPITILFNP